MLREGVKMKPRVFLQTISAIFINAILFTAVAFAQVQTAGSLTGTVTDPNGALLSGVQITVTNPATGISAKR